MRCPQIARISADKNKTRPSPATVFNLGTAFDPSQDRRDTFLTYDAWGNLVGESFASPASADDGNPDDVVYSLPFDNVYQTDARAESFGSIQIWTVLHLRFLIGSAKSTSFAMASRVF